MSLQGGAMPIHSLKHETCYISLADLYIYILSRIQCYIKYPRVLSERACLCGERFWEKKLSLLSEPEINPPNSVLSLMDRHVTCRWVKIALIWKKRWLASWGHPTFKGCDPPPKVTEPPSQLCDSYINSSLLFISECMKSSITLNGSVLRLNSLPWTTFLYVDRA